MSVVMLSMGSHLAFSCQHCPKSHWHLRVLSIHAKIDAIYVTKMFKMAEKPDSLHFSSLLEPFYGCLTILNTFQNPFNHFWVPDGIGTSASCPFTPKLLQFLPQKCQKLPHNQWVCSFCDLSSIIGNHVMGHCDCISELQICFPSYITGQAKMGSKVFKKSKKYIQLDWISCAETHKTNFPREQEIHWCRAQCYIFCFSRVILKK